MNKYLKIIIPVAVILCLIILIISINNSNISSNNNNVSGDSDEVFSNNGLEIIHPEDSIPISFAAVINEIGDGYIRVQPLGSLESKIASDIYLDINASELLNETLTVGDNINIEYYGGMTTNDSGDTYHISEIYSINRM